MPSAMDSKTLILISTLFLLSAFTIRSEVVPNLFTNLSEVIQGSFITEVLAGFFLPKGVFPSAVSKYTLSTTNKLTVEMGVDPCIVRLPSVNIRYEKTSSATLKDTGRMEDVKGIQMQVWVQVEELWVSNGFLKLRIRDPILDLDLNDFVHIPDCSRPELAVVKESGVSGEEYKLQLQRFEQLDRGRKPLPNI